MTPRPVWPCTGSPAAVGIDAAGTRSRTNSSRAAASGAAASSWLRLRALVTVRGPDAAQEAGRPAIPIIASYSIHTLVARNAVCCVVEVFFKDYINIY